MVDVSPPHCPQHHDHGHLHLGHGDHGGQVGGEALHGDHVQVASQGGLLPEVAIRLRFRTHPNIFRSRGTPVSV